MAQFTVVGTNGEPVVINTEREDATQEEAQAAYDQYQRQQWMVRDTQEKLADYDPMRSRLRESFAELHPVDQFGVGVANSALETWEGGKQLLGLEGPETQERLRIAEMTPSNLPSGLGHLAGEIAQVAIPVGAATNVTRMPFITDALVSAAQQGLKGTVEGEDPFAERLTGAGIGLMGPVIGRALGGVPATDAAQNLIDRAMARGLPMRLTPGQRGTDVWKNLEQPAEKFPILGSAIRAQERRGLRDWNRLVLNEASPTGEPVTQIGPDGLKQLKDQFDAGYRSVIESAPERLNSSPQIQQAIERLPARHSRYLSEEQRVILENESGDFLQRLRQRDVPRDEIKTIKGQFDDLAQAAANRGDVRLATAYRDLSEISTEVLRENLPQDAAMLLDELDIRYGDFLNLVLAHGYKGAQSDDYIVPAQLTGAIKRMDDSLRDVRYATRQMPGQRDAQRAEESLGRVIPRMGPGTGETLLQGALGGSLLLDPGTAAMAGGGLGLGALGVTALAPVVRGDNPVQAVFRDWLMRSTPGSFGQIGEAPLYEIER